MKISILTLFPEMFEGPFNHSIIKRTKSKGLLEIEFINLRDFGLGSHKIVDDKPYGGGVGMILRVDVIDKALIKVKSQPFGFAQDEKSKVKKRVILLDPRGDVFNQEKAQELSKLDHLILISGHYEGVDERVKEHLVDEVLSIGDYVLTGGEIPAMAIVDAVVRLLPGALKEEATKLESFSSEFHVEHPQYTQPRNYKGWEVPEILLSGNHQKIEAWKKSQT